MALITKTNALRWLVLIVVISNILFNSLYQYILPHAVSIEEMSAKYDTLFTPAGYVFSIWGVIYLTFIAYSVHQLLPSQKNNPIYDMLASPMIAINILGTMWIIAFTYEYIIPSVFIIICMVITGAMLFSIVSVKHNHFSLWVRLPFRIFLGWISVAAIVNIASCFVYLNWSGGGIDHTHWTIIMLIVTCLLALGISYRFKDLIYPSVICWASVGIAMKNLYSNSTVSTAAFLISAILLVWLLNSIIVYYVSHKNALHGTEGKIPQTIA